MVYVNRPRVFPAVLGVSDPFAARPVVFHTHNYVRARYGRKPLEWTLRAANATVIAASEYVAESYTRVCGCQNLRVVYNGVEDLQGATRNYRRPLRVGIIGRIAPEKGQMDFVRAARHIVKNGGNAEFFRLLGEVVRRCGVRRPSAFDGRKHRSDVLRLDRRRVTRASQSRNTRGAIQSGRSGHKGHHGGVLSGYSGGGISFRRHSGACRKWPHRIADRDAGFRVSGTQHTVADGGSDVDEASLGGGPEGVAAPVQG